MKMICDVPDEVVKSVKCGTWCGSWLLEKMVSLGTPLPKVGHWEFVQYDYNPNIGNWHCSECRYIVIACAEIKYGGPTYNYCPKCGAKMESEETRDDNEDN